VQFVNSKAVDDNITFVEERDQLRPANAQERAQDSAQEKHNDITIIEVV
jgi:hypothetical protein